MPLRVPIFSHLQDNDFVKLQMLLAFVSEDKILHINCDKMKMTKLVNLLLLFGCFSFGGKFCYNLIYEQILDRLIMPLQYV